MDTFIKNFNEWKVSYVIYRNSESYTDSIGKMDKNVLPRKERRRDIFNNEEQNWFLPMNNEYLTSS